MPLKSETFQILFKDFTINKYNFIYFINRTCVLSQPLKYALTKSVILRSILISAKLFPFFHNYGIPHPSSPCKKSYYHIRKLSDELCEEHHLSVILPDGQRGKSYKEWQTDKNNLSWKSRLKTDIDESIKQAQSYEQLKIALPARKRPLIKDYSRQKLIDTSDEKFADSPGLKQWATVENLKIAASSYSQSGSISELEQEIAFKNDIVKNARQSLIESEHQLKNLGQILKYAEQYKANRIYHIRYRKSKNPDAYLQRHETELLLHDGAKNMLQRMGIDMKKLDLDALRNEYNLLYAKRQKLQQTYKSTEKEITSLV